MKKIIYVTLFLLAAAVTASAKEVSRADAMKLAGKYFGGETVRFSTDFKASSEAAPAFHVFNSPTGGWVIISGEDATSPVLGYSDNGSFSTEGMPENVKWWMNRMSINIEKARSAKKVQTPATKAKWEAVGATLRTKKGLRTASTGAKLLETAEWDQDSPWNKYCPKVSGESSLPYAGCVATAMAIVLRYNQWPTQGKGTLSSYEMETSGQKVSGYSIDGKTYNWSSMSMTSCTDAAADLIHDLGVMVQMDYSEEGSGAYSSDIIPALSSHMYYSASARELYRYNYDNKEWLAMIKAEIDANRPLIYGGADLEGSGGHQFVLDGYDSNNNVHINWGWSGECNGYFPVVYLGDSEVQYVFSDYDSAIFGLVKDQNGTDKTNVEIALECDSSNELYGISLASGTIAKGSTFKINVGFIVNYDYNYAYSGAVKAALVDKDGNFKEYIGSEKTISLDAYDGTYPGYTDLEDYSCSISGDIALGDAIAMYYKLSDGSWAKMGGYAYAYKDGSKKYAYNTIYEMGAFDVPMIRIDKSYASGETFYYSVRFGQKYASKVDWYFDGSKKIDGSYQHDGYIKLTKGDHTVKCVLTYADGGTETLTQKIKVN